VDPSRQPRVDEALVAEMQDAGPRRDRGRRPCAVPPNRRADRREPRAPVLPRSREEARNRADGLVELVAKSA